MSLLLALIPLTATAQTFDASSYTDAPLRVQLAAELDAPPDAVFELVSTGLAEWMAVSDITWDNTDSETDGHIDDGSRRSCALPGKKGITETIEFWEQDSTYAYRIDWDNSEFRLPLNGQLGVFEVSPDGDGGSVLAWNQYFKAKVHPMNPMIPGFMRKKMSQGLETLVCITGGVVLDSPDSVPALADAE